MLSYPEKQRYKSHFLIPGVGEVGQQKLKSSSVLVIGAGKIGSALLQYLTSAGFGTLAILDDAIIEDENLYLQNLYGSQDIGRLKTIVSRDQLNTRNSLVKHEIINLRLSTENALEIISRYDIIADTSADYPMNLLINDACIINKKPWVFGSFRNSEGIAGSFNFDGGGSFRCAFPQKPENNDNGLFSILPGIIAGLMAAESIKMVTGNEEVLKDKILVFNSFKHTLNVENFQKKKENFNIKELAANY